MTAPLASLSLVGLARDGLSIEHDHHVKSLVAACRKALKERSPLLSWMIADRLCRITGGNEATPYLLRSAALAMQGDQAAAQRDIEAAISANPEHPEVLEIMLRGHDPARRRAAALHLAPRPDALAVLADHGASGFIRFHQSGAFLTGEGHWNGDQRLSITVTHEQGTTVEALDGQENFGGAFRWQGTLSLPWPRATRAVAISSDRAALHIDPPVLRAQANPPLPARQGPIKPESPPLMIIVPVHGDMEATRTCFEFLGAIRPVGYRLRVVAVDDATPSPDIASLLDQLAGERRIILLRHRLNLGFAAAVNNALRLREPGEDVVLLNSDAYLPQGALETLRQVALAARENGTVTPFSNNGEDVSLPRRFAVNALPGPDRIRHLDALARQENGLEAVEIPNGVGFCLYIRASVIEAIGGLSLDYERGYFEDVDFCLRARRAGFHNLCAIGAYVGHSGSVSFGGEKRALVRRNLERIHARFPEYRAASDAFLAQDPLEAAARRIIAADLPSLGPCRLMIAAENTPSRVLMALHEGMPASQLLPLVLRVGRADTLGSQSPLQLTGFDDRFPGRLTVELAALGGPAWLSALKPEELVLVDPAALPPSLGAEMVQRATRRAVAIADHALAGTALPEWCPQPPVRLVTSAAMASLIAQQNGSPRLMSPAELKRSVTTPKTQQDNPAILAIIPGEKRDLLEDFLRECGEQLAREGLSLAIVGAFEGDLALMNHPNVWLSGPIDGRDVPAWLARLGISRALFLDRQYGLADPLSDSLRQHGIGTACFGPPGDGSHSDFRLASAGTPDGLCRSIADWVRSGAG